MAISYLAKTHPRRHSVFPASAKKARAILPSRFSVFPPSKHMNPTAAKSRTIPSVSPSRALTNKQSALLNTNALLCELCREHLERGTSPTVREGFNQCTEEPSLTVGLMPRDYQLHSYLLPFTKRSPQI